MSELTPELVITNERIIATLEQIIKHLKEGNTYTDEDKEMLLYRIEEYVTGDRKKLDAETLQYLFTGWFIHRNCFDNGAKELRSSEPGSNFQHVESNLARFSDHGC